MESPIKKIWSFLYTVGQSRFSIEIEAESQTEAEERVRAISNATLEGEISPVTEAARQI